MEPERIMYALADGSGPFLPMPPGDALQDLGDGTLPLGLGTPTSYYLRGYRDAVVSLVDHLLGGPSPAVAEAEAIIESFTDDTVSTWGLKAAKVPNSRFSGRGIHVAVLDTGLDLRHPDFSGRSVTPKSFISGQEVQDGHGHGTHCIGTSCGPERPGQVRRYGCAFRAEIFAGKVLSNAGSGADTGILAGIEWALTSGCRVISMSLGAQFSLASPSLRSTKMWAGAHLLLERSSSPRLAMKVEIQRPASG